MSTGRRGPGEGRMPDMSVCVIGAGILGLATARELTRRHPGLAVTVVDKEQAVGAHQSGHNSCVVHAGLYYEPGSLKATLCRRGGGLLKEYCAEHGIAFDEIGKLVVAAEDAELPRLHRIVDRATRNGVPDPRGGAGSSTGRRATASRTCAWSTRPGSRRSSRGPSASRRCTRRTPRRSTFP